MPFVLNIFDYDGVLVDSLDDVVSASQAFCRSISHEHIPFKETIGTLETMTYPELARSVGLTPEQSELYAEYVFERFQVTGPFMSFFPEIELLLRRLASTNIAIVSGNAREVITAKLAAHELEQQIACILGAYEPGDKAEKIRNACLHFDADPGRTCMIGDSVSDIRYAKKAEVQSIAATWGWQSRELLVRERPDYIVESVSELSDLLI